jgi:phosphoribosylglycinamide formyltransferase-1
VSQFRIAVLASGSGTLFQSLIDNQEKHNGLLVGLITDVQCQAIDRAVANQIPNQIIDLGKDRNLWDQKMTIALAELNPDLIVSAGFMRIIGQAVLAKFEGKIINTHPALLPNFPGAHAVADALAAGVSETGSTVHFVDQGVDTGAIIRQQVVPVLPLDNEHELHERIKQVERELLVDVVKDFVSGKIKTKPGASHE